MLFGFLMMTAYVPGWTGAAIPTGWIVMGMFSAVMLWRVDPDHDVPWNVTHAIGAAFLGYAALTLIWWPVGLMHFVQLLAMGLTFCWASTLRDLDGVTEGLAAGFVVSIVLAVFQVAGWNFIFVGSTTPAGLFINGNAFAEAGLLLALLCAAQRKWLLVPLGIAPLILAPSRGVMMGLGLCGLVWLYKSNWRFAKMGAVAILSLTPAAAYLLYHWKPSSIDQRLDLWRDTVRGIEAGMPFGHGVGSYEWLFPAFSQLIDTRMGRPAQAHNEFLQYAFELGFGAVLLVALFTTLMRGSRHDLRYVLIGCAVVSLVSFPLHLPVTAFIAALAAGFVSRDLARLRHVDRDGGHLVPMGLEDKGLISARSGIGNFPLRPVHFDRTGVFCRNVEAGKPDGPDPDKGGHYARPVGR